MPARFSRDGRFFQSSVTGKVRRSRHAGRLEGAALLAERLEPRALMAGDLPMLACTQTELASVPLAPLSSGPTKMVLPASVESGAGTALSAPWNSLSVGPMAPGQAVVAAAQDVPPNTHRDSVTVEVTAVSVLNVRAWSLEGSENEVFIALLDSQGQVLQESQDPVEPGVSTLTRSVFPGVYIVNVDSDSRLTAGNNQVQVELTPIPDQEGGLLDFSEQPASVQGLLDYVSDRDRYFFELTQPAIVQLDMTATFDTYLELLDAEGTVVTFNDDNGTSLNSRIVWALQPGRYTVSARSFGDTSQGEFRLTARIANDREGIPIVFTNGAFTSNGVIDAGNDVDSFPLSLTENQFVRIEVQGASIPLSTQLLDSQGNVVAFGGFSNGSVLIAQFLDPGDYRLQINAFNQTGRYTVRATAGIPVDETDRQLDLAQNFASVEGVLGTPGDVDTYTIGLSTQRQLTINSNSLHPLRLELLDRSRNVLATALNIPFQNRSFAYFNGTLPRGTYYVRVASAEPNVVQGYSFFVNLADPEAEGRLFDLQDGPDTVSAAIDVAGDSDLFFVDLTEAKTLVLEANSEALDTQISVIAIGAGAPLAVSTDPVGNATRLQVDLQPGLYLVQMTSAVANATGAYTLTASYAPAADALNLTGDFNRDGIVDILDFVFLRSEFGKSGDLVADIDRNGRVDVADFARFRAALGTRA